MASHRSAALLLAGVLLGAVGTFAPPAPAGDVVSKETIDAYFRLEWSKAGRKVNGYVYNSSNRRAGHMQLLVEGLDPAGAVVNRDVDLGSRRPAQQPRVLRNLGRRGPVLPGLDHQLRLGRGPPGS